MGANSPIFGCCWSNPAPDSPIKVSWLRTLWSPFHEFLSAYRQNPRTEKEPERGQCNEFNYLHIAYLKARQMVLLAASSNFLSVSFVLRENCTQIFFYPFSYFRFFPFIHEKFCFQAYVGKKCFKLLQYACRSASAQMHQQFLDAKRSARQFNFLLSRNFEMYNRISHAAFEKLHYSGRLHKNSSV